METPDKVMKKVVLDIEAGVAVGAYGLTPAAVQLEFIYGAGSGGLTQFELFLADMGIDERRKLQLDGGALERFFGGQYRLLCQALGLLVQPETLYLLLQLRSCSEAEPREIVQAMARSMSGGSCGGGCGCGCG